MKKRGQVTIFMILGIVLLIAFGFLFFIRNVLFQAEVEANTQSKIKGIFESATFESYASSCLFETSKGAILLIGRQGGNIYESQGGMVPQGDILPIENVNISYGIIWDPQNPDYDLPDVYSVLLPTYPRLDDNIMYRGYYGNNNLPYICQVDGPNQLPGTDIKRVTCLATDRESDSTYKEGYGPDSIQEQLSYYIAKKIKECMNLSEIPELRGFEIEEGDYDVSIILGEDDVVVEATIPVFANDGSDVVKEEARFSTTLDIRLKKVYGLAYKIVEEDRRRLSIIKNDTEGSDYLISLSRGTSPALKPGFVLDISCPYCGHEDDLGYNYDDLIKITDTESKIERDDFVFMFAVENRIPALDKLPDETLQNTYTDPILVDYNIVVGSENRKIYFKTQGYDPDEDLLNYTYHKWREDYYTIFDYSKCSEYGGSIDCRINFEATMTKIDVPADPAWTDSYEYKETKREASYTTNIKDVGSHEVTVKVKDEGKLSDWQDLKILVVDTPVAKPSGYNNYSDVPDLDASIEDPYYLDASDSISLLLPLKIFNWNDATEPFSFENIADPVLRLPLHNFNIENIVNKNFTKLGEHKIYLTTSNLVVTSFEESFNVSVHECLPHRSSDTIYPYNTGDEFQADHTCCKDDYTYEDTSKECYTYTEYGTLDYFRNNPLTDDIIPGSLGVIQEEIDIPSDYGYQNDVYKRTFKRNCSGSRGNICNGPVSIRITLVDECHNECERPGSFLSSAGEPVAEAISCEAMDTNHYIQIFGQGFYTEEGTRCDDCGHLCEQEGYNITNPCCVCQHGPTTCDLGYTELGSTLEVIPPYSCTMCCVQKIPECELT